MQDLQSANGKICRQALDSSGLMLDISHVSESDLRCIGAVVEAGDPVIRAVVPDPLARETEVLPGALQGGGHRLLT